LARLENDLIGRYLIVSAHNQNSARCNSKYEEITPAERLDEKKGHTKPARLKVASVPVRKRINRFDVGDFGGNKSDPHS